MFKNVIWATDGSDAADRALAYAKELVTTTREHCSSSTPKSTSTVDGAAGTRSWRTRTT